MNARVVAPAKLTLSLRIVGLRNDGYHLIEAEMVSLSLHDILDIDTSRSGLSAEGPYAAGLPLDDSNLVTRALRLAHIDAHVAITKQVPPGGGLGGGSSDAAAILRWAGFTDLTAASAIGADVPFCMVGGRARVTGIGECVERLPFIERLVTLVTPPLAISTPAVYRVWDELGGPTGDGPNDLEVPAILVAPELAQWRDLIGDSCNETPVLAGSGATWFVLGEHSNALAALGSEGAQVTVVRTIPSSHD